MTARRYPLDPLFAAMRMTPASACRSLNVSGSTMQEYRGRGVTELVADRLATRAGFPTYSVWPEMLEHAIEDAAAEDVARAEDRRLRDNARKAAYDRQRYRNDPEWRERKKAVNRSYKEATREAQRAYARKHREANRARLAAQKRANYQANRERILQRQRAYDRSRSGNTRSTDAQQSEVA